MRRREERALRSSPSCDEVRDPADPAPDHAPPAAERLHDDAAEAFGARREDEHGRVVERARHLGRRQGHRPARLSRQVGDEALRNSAQRPATDDVEDGVGDVRSREPPCLRQHVHSLVPLEHADEERRGPLRKRERLAFEEGLQVDERGELRRWLDSRLAHEARGVARDRADAVAPPEAVAGERVRERRERLATRRSVEPGGRGRVTVNVGDDLRLHAREPPAQNAQRGFLRSLGEHGIRAIRTNLARHAKRQQRVEGEAVEGAWANRAHEPEPRISAARPGGGREHPNVDLRRQGVELLGERR